MENNYFIRADFRENKPVYINKNTDWTFDKFINTGIYLQYDVYKFCRKLIKKKDLKSVLDIGCGSALKLMKLIYPICKDIYGINEGEVSHYCRKIYGLDTFFIDNVEKSSLNLDKKFDLIICADIIEHLQNPDSLLNYIKQYSHKDSYIVISTPDRDIARGKNAMSTPNRSHIREWNKVELYRYLKNRKFHILLHLNLKAYRILFYFKEPLNVLKNRVKPHLSLIKRYGWKKYKHNQIIVTQLNNHRKKIDILEPKEFNLTIFREKLDILFILFHILLYFVVFRDLTPIFRKLKLTST